MIQHGDCREVLAAMGAGVFDACVTDPPYELGFMGKAWDQRGVAFDPATWAEVLRVLKPGAHLLAFGGTRTFHRMAVALEDAGFEIRDCVMWLYGTGFPKSHDVSKGIDKARVEDEAPIRAVCLAIRSAMDTAGLKSKDLTRLFGGCHPRLIDHWAARETDSQPSLPTWEQWETLRDTLALGPGLDAEVWRLNGRKGTPGDAWFEAEVLGEHVGEPGGFGEHRFQVRDKAIRAPSLEAAQWQGWGTALKPAWEPVIVARKPLIGTVAENVLAHGTGALNIDGCRVPTNDNLNGGAYAEVGGRGESQSLRAGSGMNQPGKTAGKTFNQPDGRWPANVIHDGSPGVLDAFAVYGERGASAPVRGTEASAPAKNVYGVYGRVPGAFHADTGSAARFFYSAKAGKQDRAGSKHPTVKPIALMRYLCRLVTPPGGRILDPFAGSGTTGEAALREGFEPLLIEAEAEYVADIKRRLLATQIDMLPADLRELVG